MAPLATFDPSLCPACWFDTGIAELAGWFDPDLVTCSSAIAAEVQEPRGKWSNYKRPRKLRLPQIELPISVDYDYVAEGGLEFGGWASAQSTRAPQIMRRSYIGRGDLPAHSGNAIVNVHSPKSWSFVPSGGLASNSGAALVDITPELCAWNASAAAAFLNSAVQE